VSAMVTPSKKGCQAPVAVHAVDDAALARRHHGRRASRSAARHDADVPGHVALRNRRGDRAVRAAAARRGQATRSPAARTRRRTGPRERSWVDGARRLPGAGAQEPEISGAISGGGCLEASEAAFAAPAPAGRAPAPAARRPRCTSGSRWAFGCRAGRETAFSGAIPGRGCPDTSEGSFVDSAPVSPSPGRRTGRRRGERLARRAPAARPGRPFWQETRFFGMVQNRWLAGSSSPPRPEGAVRV